MLADVIDASFSHVRNEVSVFCIQATSILMYAKFSLILLR